MSDAASIALGLTGGVLIFAALFAFLADASGVGAMLFGLGSGAFVLAARGR